MTRETQAPGEVVRGLLRRAETAALGTVLRGTGEPYVSLVLVATDQAARPLLLLSDLAEHAANLAGDARASLLIDGTAGWQDRLAGPRASVQGRAAPVSDAALQARFVRRHPAAARYADFADFRLYRLAIERVHLVAGFGRIAWLPAAAVLDASGDAPALAAAEPEIVAHMNDDHADALRLIATRLLGQPDGTWRMTGVDPEGCDMLCEGCLARAVFDKPVADAGQCRAELVRLTRRARERQA